MKDQLISFETAKLAKEKGFNEICKHVYILLSEQTGECQELKIVHWMLESANNELLSEFISKDLISAPTQSLLQKWSREIHNIQMFLHPYVEYPNDERKRSTTFTCDVVNNTTFKAVKSKRYPSYEEVLEQSLIEALKLIS